MTLRIDDGKVSVATPAEVAEAGRQAVAQVAPLSLSLGAPMVSLTKRVFPHQKIKESLAHIQSRSQPGAGLTDEEVATIALFCEKHLDQRVQMGATRIRAGEEFTVGAVGYKLPRSIEIVTDLSGKKAAFLTLNRLSQKDELLADGGAKKVKRALSLEDGSVKARYTCLDTPEARREIETARMHQGKIGLRLYGNLQFDSKKSPMTKLLGCDKIPAEKQLGRQSKVPMLAVYTEYAPYGDLCTVSAWKRICQMNPIQKLRLLDSALEQLEYLHSKNLVHCDVKPDNLLLFEESGALRLTIIDLEQCSMPGLASKPGGTPAYVPPEILRAEQGKYPIGSARDIWALAFTSLRFFLSRSVFPEEFFQAGIANKGDEMRGFLEYYEKIGRSSLVDARIIPKTGRMPNQNTLEYFFWKMLAFDPAKRFTAEQARKMIRALLA